MSKLTPEEKKQLKEYMASFISKSAEEQSTMVAQTLRTVYDVETPVTELVSALSDVRRTDAFEREYYLAPINPTKRVIELTSNCNATAVAVTPETRTEMTWTTLVSPHYGICIDDWIQGDHDVMRFYADVIMESMDRRETYGMIQLLEGAITITSNTFTPDTNDTTITVPKLCEMKNSLTKYGTEFVLVYGHNLACDIDLLDFTANKFREYGLDKLKIKPVKLEDLQVTIGAAVTDVIDPDTAYLIATSDSAKNKPVIFARRKVNVISAVPGADKVGTKERIIVDGGVQFNATTQLTYQRNFFGFQQYAAVLPNPLVVAKFTR